jgi:phosphoglycolate phosphatase-like HAD superfamily hydrolase
MQFLGESVTNKQERFTRPLVKSMGLDQRTPVIVCGDTTPFPKPHPAPILHCATDIRHRSKFLGLSLETT